MSAFSLFIVTNKQLFNLLKATKITVKYLCYQPINFSIDASSSKVLKKIKHYCSGSKKGKGNAHGAAASFVCTASSCCCCCPPPHSNEPVFSSGMFAHTVDSEQCIVFICKIFMLASPKQESTISVFILFNLNFLF